MTNSKRNYDLSSYLMKSTFVVKTREPFEKELLQFMDDIFDDNIIFNDEFNNFTNLMEIDILTFLK